MKIECSSCECTVDARVVSRYEPTNWEDPPPRYSFLKCNRCQEPMLISEEPAYDDDYFSPTLLYPPPDKEFDNSVPKPIRVTFREAQACFKGKTYTASAIMCRKTLEGICEAHGIRKGRLVDKLKEMKQKELIEKRLFEWADALRLFGNEAAHDVDVTISKDDAKDILEFSEALIEYVFTFRDRFNSFIKRRKERGRNATLRT